MRGESLMCMGVSYLLARSATPSHSSLWKDMTRTPFLQLRSWYIMKLTPQPSQWQSVLEVWWCIGGIWHSSIPGTWYLFRSLWMVQRRATPPSSFCSVGGSFLLLKSSSLMSRNSIPPTGPSGSVSPPWRCLWVVCSPRSGTRHGPVRLQRGARWPRTTRSIFDTFFGANK